MNHTTALSPTAQIWDQYADELLNYISLKVKSQDDAHDLRQELFLKIHLGLHHNQPRNIRGWIQGILRNTIADYYRQQYHQQLDEQEYLVFTEKDEINQAIDQHYFCCLLPFINELPERYRQVVKLHYLKGLKQEEIASIISVAFVPV